MQENRELIDDFQDFLEGSLCGYITTDPDGNILQANTRFLQWVGYNSQEVVGKKFSYFLSIGGKIYYETHLSPLLRMQHYFDEIALELSNRNGKNLPVLLNGYERLNKDGIPQFIRLTVFKAADRRTFEQNLRHEKTMVEQDLFTTKQLSLLKDRFMAELGHDLRNPLGSIVAGTSMLAEAELEPGDKEIVKIISRSASRISEMINNILDFARTRLGEGIRLERKMVNLEPILSQVINELRIIWPLRSINADLQIEKPVYCDPGRLSQLLSNLLTNAITHGASNSPVVVYAATKDHFELSVSNKGKTIPANQIENLFKPFTRENDHPSQNGLGLGLFIASEIARGHRGEISVISNEERTEFTFRMDCAQET